MSTSVREQYDKFGRSYHEKRRNPASGFWNDQIEFPAMLSLVRSVGVNKVILDAGCGTGDLVAEVSKFAHSCVGIDISETMISIARGVHPSRDFRVAVIDKLEFSSNSFDVVCSSLVLHYFDDLSRVFKEMARVLKPTGFFIFSIHHPFAEVFVDSGDVNCPFKVGEYFHQEQYQWGMAGMLLESYHHTFETISTAGSNAGFVIDSIVEPRPSAESEKVNPVAWRETRCYPKFCLFKMKQIDK
ncbi:MAG: class I SAM-dependent methyltransferase [Proteobacteria bacterium]|nr:class I SAM-dependent methyltransferase [Pseudomonadota bacterium]